MAQHVYPIRFSDQLRQHLRALRKSRHLTQAQLGTLLGVSQARIAEIEANPAAISVEQLMKILATLGVTLMLQEDVSKIPSYIAEKTKKTPQRKPNSPAAEKNSSYTIPSQYTSTTLPQGNIPAFFASSLPNKFHCGKPSFKNIKSNTNSLFPTLEQLRGSTITSHFKPMTNILPENKETPESKRKPLIKSRKGSW